MEGFNPVQDLSGKYLRYYCTHCDLHFVVDTTIEIKPEHTKCKSCKAELRIFHEVVEELRTMKALQDKIVSLETELAKLVELTELEKLNEFGSL